MEDAVRLLLSTSPGPLAHQTRCRNSWRVPLPAQISALHRDLYLLDIQLAFGVTRRGWLQHATWRYLTSPGGAEGVPFLTTASSVFSDYGNSTDHGVCADVVLSVAIGNIELN